MTGALAEARERGVSRSVEILSGRDMLSAADFAKFISAVVVVRIPETSGRNDAPYQADENPTDTCTQRECLQGPVLITPVFSNGVRQDARCERYGRQSCRSGCGWCGVRSCPRLSGNIRDGQV